MKVQVDRDVIVECFLNIFLLDNLVGFLQKITCVLSVVLAIGVPLLCGDGVGNQRTIYIWRSNGITSGLVLFKTCKEHM
jgi:hypothetical protein